MLRGEGCVGLPVALVKVCISSSRAKKRAGLISLHSKHAGQQLQHCAT